MITYIIIVNQNSIKIDFSDSSFSTEDRFVLLGSPRCIKGISQSSLLRINQVFEIIDFSFKSIIKVIQTLSFVHSSINMKIITNDECVELVCAEVREYLNLDGTYTLDVIHLVDKVEAKKRLVEAGIKTPNFLKFEPDLYLHSKESYIKKILSNMNFPLVAKPTDKTSSSGVSLIYNNSDLISWCDINIAELNYEIEEYIEGILYHCDCIVQAGQIIYTQMGEGTFPCHEITNGKNIGTRLVPHDTTIYHNISNFNACALSVLNPPDGATHMEIFCKPDGELVFLEMSARPPGGDIRWMYQLYDNVDIEKAHFLIRMGFDYQLEPRVSGFYPAFAFFPTRNGTVEFLNKPDFNSNYSINWNIHVGQVLIDAEDLSVQKAGEIRLYGDRYNVEEDFKKLRNFVPFEVMS
ncbi:MAG: acetyl-CoA carboxylase biotin carboxylase subunit family protein [Neisseriaceae bacterium]